MNKYGYNIYIKKFVNSYKIGLQNRGTLSSEWVLGLEFPLAYFIDNLDLSVLKSFTLIFGSFFALLFFVTFFNKTYNKKIEKKYLNIFKSEGRNKDELLETLDEYIQKYKNHNKEYLSERVKHLENAKKCVKELYDHLV